MATMNKPSFNAPNWYQQVTDNWTSIETNLVDKSTVVAKGDIVAATAAATPSRLAAGTNGYVLQASAAEATGLKWADPQPILKSQGLKDALWNKRFFSSEGLLPGKRIFEHFGTPPALAGSAGASFTLESGVARSSTGSAGIGWYDIGTAMSKVLFVVGSVVAGANEAGLTLTPDAPIDSTAPGYKASFNAVGQSIWVCPEEGSGYTRIDSSTGFGIYEFQTGMAIYLDAATASVMYFLRLRCGQWMLAQSATNSRFVKARYLGLFTGASNQRFCTPIICYAE